MRKNNIIYIGFKKIMDIVIGFLGTIFIVLPCFLIIFIIYKVKGYKGSIFFTQYRVGRFGKNLKFINSDQWLKMQRKF